MDTNAVEIVLKANTANLVAGMKEAASATASSGAAMREEIGNLGSASRTSAGGMNVLTDSLKEWRTHVRTEARYTNFMAAQVSGLGLASKGAAAELTGLVSAFAFGGGLGLAVEGVKLVAHVFNDIQEAEKKAKEEFDKYVEDLLAGTEKIKKQAELQLMALQGASRAQLAAAQDIKPLLEEREALEKKVAAAEADVVKLREGEGVLVAELGPKQAEIEQKELDRMREKIRLLTQQINTRQVALAAPATEQIGQDVEKDAADAAAQDKKDEQRELQHQTKMLAVRLEAMKALGKMTADQEKYQLDLVLDREKKEDEAEAEHERKVKERYAELKKQIHETMSLAKPFGDAFGKSLAGIIDGTMSLAKAFADMAKAAIKAILDAVTKAIEAYALQAAAAAAAANAGIPGIGLFLMAGAAAAAEALIMGLLDSLPSASGGWAVPHDTLAMVHAGEHVLPADIAQNYEDSAPGGDGGGDVNVTVSVNAIDGQSVDRFVKSYEFVRAIKDAVRQGRL